MTEFDVKSYTESIREEAFEEGIEQGIERGIERGHEQGRLEMLFDLVRDGDMTLKKAAAKAGLSENDFRKGMAEAGYAVV